MSVVSASCYELLGVPINAPRADVARAWRERRMEASAGAESHSVEEIEAVCARLDDAFRTLVDPARSRRYATYLGQQRQTPVLDAASTALHDPLRTPVARPWDAGPGTLAESIEAVLETGSHELPEEDTINTLDEWGTPDPERSTTNPAGFALPLARPSSLPQTVTGRHRVIARSRPRTTPSGRVKPPWSSDD